MVNSNSKSTDKLIAMTMIVDKAMDKLSPEKVAKIKKLEIKWIDLSQGKYLSDHPLPELNIEFHP